MRFPAGATIRFPSASLELLPDEVLQQILSYISAQDLARIQRLSRHFYQLSSEPILWRNLCQTEFRYWDSKHHIGQKFRGSVGDVDWKTLYIFRKNVEFRTISILDSIIEVQVDRIEKFERIAEFGYDAKDALVQQCHAPDTIDDVLARRYYANAVLDHIHRSKALEEWWILASGDYVPLERALGAFDLFVLHDQPGDLLEISQFFDELVDHLRIEFPNIEMRSTRHKALAAVKFLRRNNLTGIANEICYRDLQNNYIGIALHDPNHPSLPLISVAIYCAIANRLGLDARPCGMPNHVHAMVFPPVGETLDGHQLTNHYDDSGPMYLDPYQLDTEVPVDHLRSMLASWGIPAIDSSRYLIDTSVGNIVLRTSRNILATVHEFRGHGGATDTGHPTIQLYANPYADMDNAFYSALWANFMLSSPLPSADANSRRQFVPLLLERFERLYPMDASLIEKYICPPFNNSDNPEYWELHEALRVVRAADSTPKQLRIRNIPGVSERVKYKVGQVFRHRRYRYMAVITGWDVECGMNSDWMAHNQIDSLSRGRHQSFYHALVEDTSMRYVAEENVEIMEEMPESLESLAGRYFKRWDKRRHVFISNIRDEYPED
ncbi:Hemimethylated DNA-binding protein YccV like-domain-containing protein [Xylogone sp. PMI_703]|nr:Hemimethylated DNA-binding protein YccV like-domain-containing protein [Xylogone sp. PMI_703]